MAPLIGASWRRKDSSADSPFGSVALGAPFNSSLTKGRFWDFPRLYGNKRNGHGEKVTLTDSEPPATSTPSITSATSTPSDQIANVRTGMGGILGGGAIPTKPPLPASTTSDASDAGSFSLESSVVSQVADDPSSSDTRPQQSVPTAEIFPTAVSVAFGSNGGTSIASELVTSSGIEQTTPTLMVSSNGSGSTQPALSSPKKVEVIVGGAVGGIIFLTLIVALSVFLLRRRRQVRQEMNITNHMVIPNPDLFRPVHGTDCDFENTSEDSIFTGAKSESFTKPILSPGVRLTVRRKPVPGLILMPTRAESPFCDPRQSMEFDQTSITPKHVHVTGASAVTRNPFADPVPSSTSPPRSSGS